MLLLPWPPDPTHHQTAQGGVQRASPDWPAVLPPLLQHSVQLQRMSASDGHRRDSSRAWRVTLSSPLQLQPAGSQDEGHTSACLITQATNASNDLWVESLTFLDYCSDQSGRISCSPETCQQLGAEEAGHEGQPAQSGHTELLILNEVVHPPSAASQSVLGEAPGLWVVCCLTSRWHYSLSKGLIISQCWKIRVGNNSGILNVSEGKKQGFGR